MPRLRMCGAILPLLYTSVWRGAYVSGRSESKATPRCRFVLGWSGLNWGLSLLSLSVITRYPETGLEWFFPLQVSIVAFRIGAPVRDYGLNWVTFLSCNGCCTLICVKLEVISAVKVSMLVFWLITPCGFIGRHRRFWQTCFFCFLPWR
jgi:hypothetical protein